MTKAVLNGVRIDPNLTSWRYGNLSGTVKCGDKSKNIETIVHISELSRFDDLIYRLSEGISKIFKIPIEYVHIDTKHILTQAQNFFIYNRGKNDQAQNQCE